MKKIISSIRAHLCFSMAESVRVHSTWMFLSAIEQVGRVTPCAPSWRTLKRGLAGGGGQRTACPTRFRFSSVFHLCSSVAKMSAALFLIVPAVAQAEVKPAALFSDNAVLQQGMDLPIWGTAREGEVVTVECRGQKVSTAAKAGKWLVKLNPLKAGAPFTVVIKGENRITLTNVMAGEVWLCSGQSNMERQLGPRSGQKPLENWVEEMNSANYPQLRHFAVARKSIDMPLEETSGKWEICSPQTVSNFTAVGYYFGRDLHRHLKTPVGLIHSSWGGTPAEAWTRSEVIEQSFPEMAAAYKKSVATYPAVLAKYKAEEQKLLADWEKASEEAKAKGLVVPRKPGPPRDPAAGQSRPANLYNGMVAPLIPYAIRGVIWYQGESNNGRHQEYQKLFPAMIADWRKQWGGTAFPFLFVQIAPHRGMSPEIREAQLVSWKTTPNTAMVVTTDIGDANDIHPTRKEPVGARLALAARALAYGEKLEYSGPVFQSAEFKDGKAVIAFSHIGDGLLAKAGTLQGFEVAGADGHYAAAQADIVGQTVVVTSPQILQPTVVRYGWTNVPVINLFNKNNLPATPFRSDDPALTKAK